MCNVDATLAQLVEHLVESLLPRGCLLGAADPVVRVDVGMLSRW